MNTILTLAVFFAIATPVGATTYPYETTIRCGEISTAILTFGADVAAACEAGRDAIPAFTTVEAYERYYRSDDDRSCDADCLRPTYMEMKRAGLMHPLISGDPVTVLSEFADPGDKHYTICRVKAKGRHWLVLCLALAE